MPKNLVVCCDGTANEFARDHTDVVKLFSALVQDPGRQLAFHHPGVGTVEAVGALTSAARKVTKLLGKAVGYGLEADIRDAYASIMGFYEDGDSLFLFGFSRGAYTVRAVASLLQHVRAAPAGVGEGVAGRLDAGRDAARAFVTTAGGKAAMDEARDVAATVVSAERTLLDRLTDRVRARERWVVAVGLATAPLSITRDLVGAWLRQLRPAADGG